MVVVQASSAFGGQGSRDGGERSLALASAGDWELVHRDRLKR